MKYSTYLALIGSVIADGELLGGTEDCIPGAQTTMIYTAAGCNYYDKAEDQSMGVASDAAIDAGKNGNYPYLNIKCHKYGLVYDIDGAQSNV